MSKRCGKTFHVAISQCMNFKKVKVKTKEFKKVSICLRPRRCVTKNPTISKQKERESQNLLVFRSEKFHCPFFYNAQCPFQPSKYTSMRYISTCFLPTTHCSKSFVFFRWEKMPNKKSFSETFFNIYFFFHFFSNLSRKKNLFYYN